VATAVERPELAERDPGRLRVDRTEHNAQAPAAEAAAPGRRGVPGAAYEMRAGGAS